MRLTQEILQNYPFIKSIKRQVIELHDFDNMLALDIFSLQLSSIIQKIESHLIQVLPKYSYMWVMYYDPNDSDALYMASGPYGLSDIYAVIPEYRLKNYYMKDKDKILTNSPACLILKLKDTETVTLVKLLLQSKVDEMYDPSSRLSV